jgi:hypothetical protein
MLVQEDAGVPDEQLRVLKMRTVIRVRVQDQLGVRQELLENVGVDRRADEPFTTRTGRRRPFRWA